MVVTPRWPEPPEATERPLDTADEFGRVDEVEYRMGTKRTREGTDLPIVDHRYR